MIFKLYLVACVLFFFFQAEDGIRDGTVTGVQTCALPISAAFNAMLTDANTGGPLVMHAGDTITDHQYVTAARDGMHITVSDLTTGHAGTRSEEHTSELQSQFHLVCRLLLEKKKK